MNPLNHVAIIMDGNGRWGLRKKNSRNAGHRAGLNTVEKIIKETKKEIALFDDPMDQYDLTNDEELEVMKYDTN